MHTPKYTLRALLLGLALCSMPVGVFGQGSSVGAITGTVTDPSGSPIPAAQITLRNIQTNSARAQKVNSSGEFTIPSLPVGNKSRTSLGSIRASSPFPRPERKET
jgi:hypothetical protein